MCNTAPDHHYLLKDNSVTLQSIAMNSTHIHIFKVLHANKIFNRMWAFWMRLPDTVTGDTIAPSLLTWWPRLLVPLVYVDVWLVSTSSFNMMGCQRWGQMKGEAKVGGLQCQMSRSGRSWSIGRPVQFPVSMEPLQVVLGRSSNTQSPGLNSLGWVLYTWLCSAWAVCMCSWMMVVTPLVFSRISWM